MPILKSKTRKDGTSEDICKSEEEVQTLTNSYIRKVDELVHKDAEIMKV
jgi:ribosome recycling factor